MNNLPGMVYRCKKRQELDDGICERWVRGTLRIYKPEELLNNNVISFNDLINTEDRDWIWEVGKTN
jgi:hypothetical protein